MSRQVDPGDKPTGSPSNSSVPSAIRADAGYFDLQVNGYDGVDFNADDLSAVETARICRRLLDEGVAGILATVITDREEALERRLQNVCRVRREEPLANELIWGIHLEGPFLNEQPGYIGAHPPSAAQVANLDVIERLWDAAEGTLRMVTLAPERDPGGLVTRWLVDRGVRVSAGHCNPSLDELQGAIDAGLSMFTHLGNGCPLLMHRHDNVIQRALSLAERLWVTFIADGVHVPYPALGNYLRLAGMERAVVVTDAISAAGRGPGRYQLGGQQVVVDERLATWCDDGTHLAGAATTMPRAAANLRAHLGLSDDQVRRLTCENPRRALGL